MVALVEPMCMGWEHEEVNSGLLKLIDNTTEDKISYYGDRGQVQAVSNIYYSVKVNFKEIEKIPEKEIRDTNRALAIYIKILRTVVKDSRPDTVFILSGDRPCMMAVQISARIYPKVNFLMILHAILDPKLGHTSSCAEIMRKSVGIPNLSYITYSPFAEALLGQRGIDNILFLHHPYIEAVEKKDRRNKHDKYRIGIIGACSNRNAYRFVDAVGHEPDIADKYEFWIASRGGSLFKGLENAKIVSSEFDRGYIEAFMKQIDYLLLPYGRNDYRIAASGILWDAVSNKVPCLAYDSRYICFYQKRHNIGIQRNSLRAMLETLKEIEKNEAENEEYFVNMDTLERDNQKIIREILEWRTKR